MTKTSKTYRLMHYHSADKRPGAIYVDGTLERCRQLLSETVAEFQHYRTPHEILKTGKDSILVIIKGEEIHWSQSYWIEAE